MQATGRGAAGNADLYDVEDPGPNDVLFGRGTGSNMHSGNIRFRALIQKYKPVYRDTPKKMKPSVSTKVVAIWRSQNPPGRFLTRSDRFHGSKRTFYDVGDAMARRKAAQCLREKSSKERIQQQLKAGEKMDEEVEGTAADTTEHEDDPKVITSAADEPMFPSLESELESKLVNAPGVNTVNSKNSKLSLPQEDEEDIDLVTSANFAEKFGTAITPTNEPPKTEIVDSSSAKMSPLNLKTLVQSSTFKKPDEAAWLACGSPKSDSMSLVNTYESNLKDGEASDEDRNGTSDSPFLFASFDFESSSNQQGNSSKDEGGLCFPSLFGGASSGKASPSLFDDEAPSTGLLGAGSSSAFPSLFGGSTPSFPFEEETESAPLPPEFSPALPKLNAKKDTLQNIRDRMPTAASLTTNLFDW